MAKRTLRYMPLDDLVEAERNPRRHSARSVRDLADAVVRFGFNVPPLYDERTQSLAAGHKRKLALRQLRDGQEQGAAVPDGITVTKDGKWCVPVVRGWSSADDKELRAFIVADNKHAADPEWIADELREILEELDDLSGTGFTDDELDEMLKRAESASPRTAQAANPSVVDFRFGDYGGKVQRALYEKFVAEFERRRESSDVVLLDDVLVAWLDM